MAWWHFEDYCSTKQKPWSSHMGHFTYFPWLKFSSEYEGVGRLRLTDISLTLLSNLLLIHRVRWPHVIPRAFKEPVTTPNIDVTWSWSTPVHHYRKVRSSTTGAQQKTRLSGVLTYSLRNKVFCCVFRLSHLTVVVVTCFPSFSQIHTYPQQLTWWWVLNSA